MNVAAAVAIDFATSQTSCPSATCFGSSPAISFAISSATSSATFSSGSLH